MSMTIFGGKKDGFAYSTMVDNYQKFMYDTDSNIYGVEGYYCNEEKDMSADDFRWDGTGLILFRYDGKYNFIDGAKVDGLTDEQIRQTFNKMTAELMKSESLVDAIKFELDDEGTISKADDLIGSVSIENQDGYSYVNIPLDTSIHVTGAIAEYILSEDAKAEIAKENECEGITEAIELGNISFSVSLSCDEYSIFIVLEDVENDKTYKYEPYNQRWFRDFANKELCSMGHGTIDDILKYGLLKEEEITAKKAKIEKEDKRFNYEPSYF